MHAFVNERACKCGLLLANVRMGASLRVRVRAEV